MIRRRSVDGIAAWIFAEHAHLDKRDEYAVRRLAQTYLLIDNLMSRLKRYEEPPFTPGSGSVAKAMDEYHKLWADALRLEEALGITPAARARHKIASEPDEGALGKVKA